jgi:hypothetical protein
LNEDKIKAWKRDFQSNVFYTMELSKQSYSEIMNLPVKRFHDYVDWKIKYNKDNKVSSLGNIF